MNLGNALSTLGARETGTARLEEAVSAFRLALQELTRERVPLHWAEAQMNLGNALARLGEREAATAPLEEAVSSFRLALQEWTRERVPLQWAQAQMSLGVVLSVLGERETGTARLSEAVTAWICALRSATRAGRKSGLALSAVPATRPRPRSRGACPDSRVRQDPGALVRPIYPRCVSSPAPMTMAFLTRWRKRWLTTKSALAS